MLLASCFLLVFIVVVIIITIILEDGEKKVGSDKLFTSYYEYLSMYAVSIDNSCNV